MSKCYEVDVDAMFRRFGIEPFKDLDQSKVRSMISEACALAAEFAMRERVQVLSLRPGDLLVVHMPQEMDRAYPARLTEQWSEVLKEFSARAVICNGVERFSILRSDNEAHDG